MGTQLAALQGKYLLAEFIMEVFSVKNWQKLSKKHPLKHFFLISDVLVDIIKGHHHK